MLSQISSWLIIVACLVASGSQAREVDLSIESQQELALGRYTGVFLDDGVSMEDIVQGQAEHRFELSGGDVIPLLKLDPDYWLHGSWFWFRITFNNPTARAIKIYLDHDGFPFKQVKLYSQDGQLLKHLERGEESNWRMLTVVTGPQQRQTIYLHVKPYVGSYFYPRYWTNELNYYEAQGKRDSIYTTSLAIVGMSMLFNIVILIAYRQIVHVHYLCYLGFFGLWIYVVWNLNSITWGHSKMIALTCTLMALSATVFSMSFLEVRRHRLCFLSLGTLAVLMGFVSIYCVVDGYYGLRAIQKLSILGTPLLLACGIYTYIKYRQTHVLIYCIGYGTMLIGVTFTLLFNLNYLQHPSLRVGMHYGATLESIIMLMAIAQKVLEREKERRHTHSQLEKVFYPHQLEQLRKGWDLEETMPVGEREACILAFDVIGSTKIDDPRFAELFEDFMVRARTMMMDQYQSQTLTSTGYMIKEMGDGFLCSIGFPFCETAKSKEVCALILAERLISEFNHYMEVLKDRRPVSCAVGITKGAVKGYFSKSGAIRHDLWGRALVLATRYEHLRGMIFKAEKIPESHILILQDRVYQSLPLPIQRKFHTMNLADHGINVRDDVHANSLAYRTFSQVLDDQEEQSSISI